MNNFILILLTFSLGYLFFVLKAIWKVRQAPLVIGSVDVEFSWVDSIHVNSGPSIPAIIHHLSPTEEIPPQWQNSYLSCKLNSLHQSYSFMLWTDERIMTFLSSKYGWFLDLYNSYEYDIQRIDAARYIILYHFGGIYLDLDVGCRTGLSAYRYLPQGLILPETSPFGLSNDVMFAVSNHSFLRFAIERLDQYHRSWIFNYPTVMFSSGPAFISRVLVDYCLEYDCSSTNLIQSIGKLNHRHYTEINFFHMVGSSWHKWDARVAKIVLNNFPLFLFVSVVLILAFRCKKCKKYLKPRRKSRNSKSEDV